MEPAAPIHEEPDPHLTAWHVFLVEMLRCFTDPRRVEVRDFVKLGTLPLEADAILLLKKDAAPAGAPAHVVQADLDFLEPRLRDLTVLEYKSPRDVLGRGTIDIARVYALLAKQKYQITEDRRVSLVLLYSYAQRRLFDDLGEDGLVFEEEEEGIRCCPGSLVMYAVNLLTLGRRRPRSPLNLVSGRHAEYAQDPGMDPGALALVERIQYLIRQGKVRGMALNKLHGFEEISRDTDAIRRRLVDTLPPEERRRFLDSLAPEERLQGLAPEERLHGLAPGEEDELLALLLARRQQQR